MAEDFTHIEYSAEDIERYLRGRMDAKEMYGLERAALQDPFLADAIEGYQHASFQQAYKHLGEISAGIGRAAEPAPVVPLPVKAVFNWWQAAAVVVLICCVGGGLFWLGHNGNGRQPQTNAAVAVKQVAPAMQPSVGKGISNGADTLQSPNVAAKSNTAAGNAIAANKRAGTMEAISLKLVAAQPVVPPPNVLVAQPQDSAAIVYPGAALAGRVAGLQVQEPVVADKKISGLLDSVAGGLDDGLAFRRAKNLETNKKVYNISPALPQTDALKQKGSTTLFNNTGPANNLQGFVLDENRQALGNVLVYSPKGRQLALTDDNGYFKLNTADTQLAVQVSSAGYQTTQALLNANKANAVVINKSPQLANNSVEVIQFGSYKKRAKPPVVDSLFPDGGWQSFREYVYKKLHKEKDMDTTGAEITYLGNTVEIEFLVDENGIARDLKITRGVNEKVDAKALEAVQQWPKWIATRKNKLGKVVIRF